MNRLLYQDLRHVGANFAVNLIGSVYYGKESQN